MNNFELYVMVDVVAERSMLSIMLNDNDKDAFRTFERTLIEQQHLNPKDYELVKIGSFDTKTLKLSALTKPKIVTPIDFLNTIDEKRDTYSKKMTEQMKRRAAALNHQAEMMKNTSEKKPKKGVLSLFKKKES